MLFDSIIERSTDNVVFYKSWKSNQKHRIGMRLRKSRFILPRFRMGFSRSLDYEDERFLADIDKALHYLHGGTGDFDGLVRATRENRIETGDRFSSRYFEFRYYRGSQTLHLYPKSVEVMDKLNRFVGKIRQWLPGDMEEANADFIKQYEKGETFSDEYLELSNKSRPSYDRCNPAYKLLREVQGRSKEEGAPELDRLEKAINEVHEKHGLQCGPALTGKSALKAIAHQPEAEKARPIADEPEQLLLLAA